MISLITIFFLTATPVEEWDEHLRDAKMWSAPDPIPNDAGRKILLTFDREVVIRITSHGLAQSWKGPYKVKAVSNDIVYISCDLQKLVKNQLTGDVLDTSFKPITIT